MPGRVLTPQDCYALINQISEEVQGLDGTITAVDTSSFVSVGENILRAGVENTLNAISLVVGRTLIAVRPYEAKLRIINTLNSGLFSNRVRKISYLSRHAQPSGAFNTDLYINHAMGYDNGANSGSSVGSMWEQNQPVPVEFNFAGSSVWDESTTIYEDQLQQAFASEENFSRFMGGVLTEKGNDIEQGKENFNRATLLNYMAGLYDLQADLTAASLPGILAIDCTAAFNADNGGTTYTTAQLKTTYFKEFLEWFVGFVAKLSDKLTYRNGIYHLPVAKTINGVQYNLLRHTPKAKQKLILYKPMFIDAETKVLPEIFHDEKLQMVNYEGVDFWQDFTIPAGINVTPAIPDISDLSTQKAGTTVALDDVIGVIYDEDAMMVDYQMDASYSTPVEARKRYRNIWWHFRKNSINDFTEQGVLLYMA